jgi:hypothetical protein
VTSMDESERLAELHQTLEATVEFLNVDEMEVLIEVAQGLVRGQKVYGHLDIEDDPREFPAEACEELRDCMAYVGMAIRRLRRANGVS